MKNVGRHDNLSFEIYDSIILHALDYNHDYTISFKIWAQIWLKGLVLDILVKSTPYGFHFFNLNIFKIQIMERFTID